ncbi:acetyl-CoA carboxylase biotin carboxylase subunit [uncultured Christiangramia sp.]|uniref:acetyl-CoA carboxylase biotin carboxylase subunit n=1 Tax=uncultured Christiangramia sp. TaxID=503836 RepID=UPI0025E2D0B3|nr:acetyl-CoA carboxylase biotin carboxylase subunit [uncultured Christiangramia sp.]
MSKVLIANRGEISLRIARACRELGIGTLAVYSEADEQSLHVQLADEAICIGPPSSAESYLRGDRIMSAAEIADVDAIHPGYGFLSENADFAEQCEACNILFIGPRSETIRKMGDKALARETVSKAGVPIIPGSDGPVENEKEALRVAKKIGFPVIIKAVSGGGGRGMRIAHNAVSFTKEFLTAKMEAEKAFGDGTMYVEKYLENPRHIEFQILADKHGKILHLGERDCSVQRRHQKVVEEAPSVVLDDDLRAKMGEAAVKVAKACDYVGAGTVEFLFDENRNFYFLEMNTRLQVEHPVTEYITGVDLVEQQIRIARGEAIAFTQNDLKIKGHAMELRVYAEDPLEDFMPSTGTLEKYQIPQGEGIRMDNGFEEGMEVPIYYDPMLAKLVTYGKTREEAIEVMIKAIDNYIVEGVSTTLAFGKFVFQHDAFRSGDFDTHFVKKYYSPDALKEETEQEARLAALLALKQYLNDKEQLRLPSN